MGVIGAAEDGGREKNKSRHSLSNHGIIFWALHIGRRSATFPDRG